MCNEIINLLRKGGGLMGNNSSALKAFGENIHFLQRCEGSTQESFAKKLCYDRGDYGKLLWGEKNIKLLTAERMAERTGFALSALLDTSFADDEEYRKKSPYEKIDTLAVFLQSIKRHMQRRRITMSDISSDLDIDKAALSRILSGQIKNPTIGTMDKLAQTVDCRLSELLREEKK